MMKGVDSAGHSVASGRSQSDEQESLLAGSNQHDGALREKEFPLLVKSGIWIKDVGLPAAALADIAAFFGEGAFNPALLATNKNAILSALAGILGVKTPFTLTDAHQSNDGVIKVLLAAEGGREFLTALVCLGAEGDMGANTSGFGFELSLWAAAAISVGVAARHASTGKAWAGDATKAVLGTALAAGFSMVRHSGIPYAGNVLAFAGSTALAAWPIASRVATYWGWGSEKAQGAQVAAVYAPMPDGSSQGGPLVTKGLPLDPHSLAQP